MSLIKKGLLVGNERDSRDLKSLKRNGVTHILCAAQELGPAHPGKFVYRHVMADDVPNYNISRYFDHAADFIHDALTNGGTVLVHCAAGISRSVSLTMAYLLKHEGHKFASALSMIKSRRAIANPNPGFMKQLKDYEKRLEMIRPRYSYQERKSDHSPTKYSPSVMQRRFPLRFSVSYNPRESAFESYGAPVRDFTDQKLSIQCQPRFFGSREVGSSNMMARTSVQADRHSNQFGPLRHSYVPERNSTEIRPFQRETFYGALGPQMVERPSNGSEMMLKYLKGRRSTMESSARPMPIRSAREILSVDRRQAPVYRSSNFQDRLMTRASALHAHSYRPIASYYV